MRGKPFLSFVLLVALSVVTHAQQDPSGTGHAAKGVMPPFPIGELGPHKPMPGEKDGQAPYGGLQVDFGSSVPGTISPPASVTIPQYGTSKSITVSTGRVTANTPVTLTAFYNAASVKATITIGP